MIIDKLCATPLVAAERKRAAEQNVQLRQSVCREYRQQICAGAAEIAGCPDDACCPVYGRRLAFRNLLPAVNARYLLMNTAAALYTQPSRRCPSLDNLNAVLITARALGRGARDSRGDAPAPRRAWDNAAEPRCAPDRSVRRAR